MKPLKDKVSITLDPDIIEQIKSLAEQDARSLSQFINLILRKYLQNRQAKNKDTIAIGNDKDGLS